MTVCVRPPDPPLFLATFLYTVQGPRLPPLGGRLRGRPLEKDDNILDGGRRYEEWRKIVGEVAN